MISDISRLDKIFRTYIFFKFNSIRNETFKEAIKNNSPRIIKKDLMSPNKWILNYYLYGEGIAYVKNIGETTVYADLLLSQEGHIKSIDFWEH